MGDAVDIATSGTGMTVGRTAPASLPMPVDRLTRVGAVRAAARSARGPITLVAGALSRHPRLWEVYRSGLHRTYSRIGAGDLVPGPELPAVMTTVILAVDELGRVVGGARRRWGTDLHRHPGIVELATGIGAAIDDRARDGLGEGCGSWITPGIAGAGLGTALVQGVLQVANGSRHRWTVALVNQLGLRAAMEAGCVPDPRYVDLPYPDARFRSTLAWFDHRAGQT